MTQNEDDATIALELKEKFSDINNSDTKESQYEVYFQIVFEEIYLTLYVLKINKVMFILWCKLIWKLKINC